MKPVKPHESMRGYFSYALYEAMEKDPSIYVVCPDLGMGMLDAIKEDFPDRFILCGAAEQAAMGIACGLALSGKKPVIYSITPFLLARAFETIRNYVNYEKIPVKLIGGGRDRDYSHDGQSHWSEDAKAILDLFPNIAEYWPEDKSEMTWLVNDILKADSPVFVSLKR